MIISGYEKPVEYGRQLIFDPTMANMVLLALRDYNLYLQDEYERGLKMMDDFYKQRGDFMSPFAKDMERYGQMIGGVRGAIDEAYANGIDLLRSPEGRIFISRLTNSIDPREFNNMRANAKLGYLYLANIQEAIRKGEFDEDFEKFRLNQLGLGDFDSFSSANGAIWNQTGPGVYQDVNKWTHHLFDNMELSYDPELSKKYPGFMAYTKSRDTMNQIINNNIAGLLNTDLGKYRLLQLKNSGLSDEQAVSALKKMVVDSNYEENLVKLVEDPIYREKLKHSLEMDKIYTQNRLKNDLDGDGKVDASELEFAKRQKEAKIYGSTVPHERWTQRQRVNIMDNQRFNELLRLEVAKAKSGTSPAGAKMQLISQGILKPTQDLINAKIAENKKLLQNQEMFAKYYSTYTTNVEGADLATATALFAGMSKDEAIGNVEGVKRKPIEFGPKSDLSLTAMRERTYAGVSSLSSQTKLQNYLTRFRVSGYVPTEKASVSYKDYAPGRSVFDINSTVRVKASDLQGLDENSQERINILKNCGAVLRNSDQKVINKDGKIAWETVLYVDIPVSRTIDSHGYVDSEIDTIHEILNNTKNNASKMQGRYEDQDINNMTYGQ